MVTKKGKAQSAKRLAKTNPKVDLSLATEALNVVDELRNMGQPGPKYRLASPYGHTIGGCANSWGDQR